MVQRQDYPWYVIQVMTGKERVVCEKIEKLVEREQFFSVFFPTVLYRIKKQGRVSVVYKPMFPGYVFIISDRIERVNESLKSIQEMTKLLKSAGTDVIEELAPEEKSFLDAFLDDEYKVGMSEGIIENDMIIVTKGVLQGYEGQIKKIDRHKKVAWVEVSINNNVKRVKMPLEIIRKE